jgi:hypothetical protein
MQGTLPQRPVHSTPNNCSIHVFRQCQRCCSGHHAALLIHNKHASLTHPKTVMCATRCALPGSCDAGRVPGSARHVSHSPEMASATARPVHNWYHHGSPLSLQ